jgi:hypothetical protein
VSTTERPELVRTRREWQSRRRRRRRQLCAAALALVAAVAVGLGLSAALTPSSHGSSAASETRRPRQRRTAATAPLAGALLIADRGNDRILLVDAAHRVRWSFPTRRDRARGLHLNFNDDAFVARGGRSIVANEEEAHTIVAISIRTHQRVHLFGLPGVRGSGASLLNTPDDAYPLPNGSVVVADAYNCRILWISARRIVRQLGEDRICRHDPPRRFGPVNGDTPLANGGLLISEITGHWVDEIGPGGQLRWAVQPLVRYPSDPQPVPGGRVLLADYSNPGQVIVMNDRGAVLWRYGPAAGAGRLDHPSLALWLGGGKVAVTDDYRDRVVVIDMPSKRIIWQYGRTDQPGSRSGYLKTPDGLDLVPLDARGNPNWAAVHHP